tara:strand:+ start:295 stop:894 length:600 start_codon:yes stop_codon:yes gene_type:complete
MAIAINGSSNTITGVSVGGLPDGIVDTDMLAANAVTAAKASGIGITMTDQWRISSNFSLGGTSAAFMTSNWERNDDAGYAKIGTGMSESSGEFSFPTTGIYLVGINVTGYANGGAFDWASVFITYTVDNSNYGNGAIVYESARGNGQWFAMATEMLFDVTDTSTHKIKFKTQSNNTRPVFQGTTTTNRTFAHFTRLGDT